MMFKKFQRAKFPRKSYNTCSTLSFRLCNQNLHKMFISVSRACFLFFPCENISHDLYFTVFIVTDSNNNICSHMLHQKFSSSFLLLLALLNGISRQSSVHARTSGDRRHSSLIDTTCLWKNNIPFVF